MLTAERNLLSDLLCRCARLCCSVESLAESSRRVARTMVLLASSGGCALLPKKSGRIEKLTADQLSAASLISALSLFCKMATFSFGEPCSDAHPYKRLLTTSVRRRSRS